ncbi:MAG: cyclase family protein, partial [Desulfurococcales archaeon]|nr:cyclase family protein [Desulfurococcales archaeon]
MRVLDLTLPVGPGTWTYPGDPKPRVEVNHVGEYRVERVCMGSHTGTHVDAPAHFLPEGVSVDRIEASRLVAPGV